MRAYIARRLFMFIPTILAVSLIVFFFIYLIPGDPTALMLGAEASASERAHLREQLGLNEPLLTQMRMWFTNLARGDLGHSHFLGTGVTDIILTRLPVTASLAVLGLLFAIGIGVPAGIIAAAKQQTWIDSSVMFGSVLGLSIPNFWLGLNLILLFAVVLGWLPSGGYVPLTEDPVQAMRRLILPAFVVGLSSAAVIARMTRSAMLEVLRLDYVRTARAKGLSSMNVNLRHAFRNALIPIVTVIGTVFGSLLNGSIVTETVFNLRGVGLLIVDAVNRRDFPVIQGGILFVTVVYLTINLIVDLLYAWLDPRIRYD